MCRHLFQRVIKILLIFSVCCEQTSKKPKYDTPDDAQILPLVLPLIKVSQIHPIENLSQELKNVAWNEKPWDVVPKLRETLRFLPAKCKERFQICIQEDKVSINYCSGLKKQTTCLMTECTSREIHWISLAACLPDSSSQHVEWSKIKWPANILLQNEVNSANEKCQKSFEKCAEEVGDVKSYCAMMVLLAPVRGSPRRELREECLSEDCPRANLVDAACTRSVLRWEEGIPTLWFAGTRLQVVTASLQVGCQERVQYCKDRVRSYLTADDLEKKMDSYCSLVTVHKDCLLGLKGDKWSANRDGEQDVCSVAETDAFYKGACNSEQFNPVRPGSGGNSLSGVVGLGGNIVISILVYSIRLF